MQLIRRVLFMGLMISLIACGNKKETTSVIAEKKATLEALKKQQITVGDAITKLEAEIIKLDPSILQAEKAKLVVTTAVTTEKFTHYIDLQGKVDAINISYIAPRGGGGLVRELYVKKGDNVTKGQLILKLDDAIVKQSIIAGEQGIESIKTQLAFAKNIYQKQQNLWAQNIGTEVQLITAKNNVEAIENQLKTAQEQIKITQEQLKFTAVYSNVAGVADDVNIRVGELFVGPGQIKIVNTNDLKITTLIPENYATRVGVGTVIKISLPDINKTIDATISVVGKIIDPNTRSFFVEAKIPADKSFRPNQIALVKVQDYQVANAITVPVNILQTDEKGRYILIVINENNKLIARKKAVVSGELYGDKIEIKSGIAAGDQIITDGYQSLYDGQTITTVAK